MALHFAVKLKNKGGKAGVVSASADGVHKQQKIVVGAFVRLLQNTLQDALTHGHRPVLLDNTEVGRKAEGMTVFTQKCGAEAVDGAYLCLAAQCALLFEASVCRIVCNAFGKLLVYAAFEFGSRRLGKGYDKILVYVCAAFYSRQQPFGQNLGLAGACGGGDKYAASLRFDGTAL